MPADSLEMFVVYRNPRDFPGKVVVRRFVIGDAPDKQPHFVGDSVEAARATLPRNLVCCRRDRSDEKQIVETWF